MKTSPPIPDNIPQDTDDINEELLYDTFFGKESGYYKNRLMRMRSGTNAIFNGYAFFLGILWFAYRKMYVEVAIIILAMIVLEIVWEFAGLVDTSFNGIISLIYAFILGYTANYFYIKKAIRTVERAKQTYINPGDRLNYLEKEGDVSMLGPILILVAFIVLVIAAFVMIDFGQYYLE